MVLPAGWRFRPPTPLPYAVWSTGVSSSCRPNVQIDGVDQPAAPDIDDLRVLSASEEPTTTTPNWPSCGRLI